MWKPFFGGLLSIFPILSSLPDLRWVAFSILFMWKVNAACLWSCRWFEVHWIVISA
jgi:hypothetical protein